MNLLVNIGNTHTEWGTLEEVSSGKIHKLKTEDLLQLTSPFEGYKTEEITLFCSCVIPQVKRIISERFKNTAFIHYKDAESMGVSFEKVTPDTIGADRLCNAIYVANTFKKATLIIDIGTAINCELIDGKGTFLGGVIAPGRRLALQAMHQGTGQLPALVPMQTQNKLCNNTTASTMQNGVHMATIGFIKEIIFKGYQQFGEELNLILTGGDMYIFIDELKENFDVTGDPIISLKGLKLWYESQKSF
ncbi:MAG: type III pantothenate kinase [Lentisphaeria bacterium]|nr:type III pantothenate kinase [Lentisphaeria bacterium]